MPEQIGLYLDGIAGLTDEERAYLERRLGEIRGQIGNIDEAGRPAASTAVTWRSFG